jgi:hypothetical protein
MYFYALWAWSCGNVSAVTEEIGAMGREIESLLGWQIIIAMYNIPKRENICQITTKYTNIFRCKTLQNLTKVVFLF